MKIVFNSRHPESPATIFYKSGMINIADLRMDVFDSYEDFDVILVMGFGRDLQEAKLARSKNTRAKIGLLDPRGYLSQDVVKSIDFLVVDSIEMQDFFTQYGKPVFRYVEYLDVARVSKKHEKKDKIVIGYHGNKIHLMAMYPKITSALDALSSRYNIEFWAVYNIKNLGLWNLGLPATTTVKHIQWSEEKLSEVLGQIDIGIVPALIPFQGEEGIEKSRWPFTSVFNHQVGDYCWRFKMPTNFGRGIVFAMNGVPIVSDPFPSAFEFIQNGQNGFLAYSSAAWYVALEKLIKDHNMRNEFAEKMDRDVFERVNYKTQNMAFTDFLKNIDMMEVCPGDVRLSQSYSWWAIAKYRICRRVEEFRLKILGR